MPDPQELAEARGHEDVLALSERIWGHLRSQASSLANESAVLGQFFQATVLDHADFTSALGTILAEISHGRFIHRSYLRPLLVELSSSDEMHRASIADMLQVAAIDPARPDPLTVLLNYKGYHALQIYRASHQLWLQGDEASKHTARMLQGRACAMLSMDLHPAARIGHGVFMDHGTGIVIGETASVGNECYLLHGVTLGSTGKLDEEGNRHPQVGSGVHIGANATILGPVRVGDGAVIGAKAIVTKDVLPGQTVVGTNRALGDVGRAEKRTEEFPWIYEI